MVPPQYILGSDHLKGDFIPVGIAGRLKAILDEKILVNKRMNGYTKD